MLNSVRAAQTMSKVGAGSRVALWGHSQGGHSVLWTQALAAELAPELTVVATVAAAPAAELPTLMSREWDEVGGSLIGAYVLVAWPEAYPGLSVESVWDSDGGDYRELAQRCITGGLVEVELRKIFGKSTLFRVDPMTVAAWRSTAEQAIPPAPVAAATMIAQGLSDPLVLPGSNAAFIEMSCDAGWVCSSDLAPLGRVVLI